MNDAIPMLFFLTCVITLAFGEFTCPKGQVAVQGTRPGPDGCSYVANCPYGPCFTECCNKHDDCYQTCNSDKTTCDTAFGDCMMNICEKFPFYNLESRSKCEAWAATYKMGVTLVAQSAYDSDQAQVCVCKKMNEWYSHVKSLNTCSVLTFHSHVQL